MRRSCFWHGVGVRVVVVGVAAAVVAVAVVVSVPFSQQGNNPKIAQSLAKSVPRDLPKC